MYTRKYMGDKLYWRTKKDGKWTWKPATTADVIRWMYPQGEEE